MIKKIINFVKNNKILVFLFFILLVLLSLQLFFIKKTPLQEQKEPAKPLEKEKQIAPGKKEGEEIEIKRDKALTLFSVYPQPGINETTLDKYKISFTFSENLKSDSLSYQIKPSISLKSYFEKNKLSFYPSQAFLFNTDYLLAIKSLESTGGASLKEPIDYQFRLVFPEKIIFDEHH
jgi:hypothetical protein